MDPLDRITTGKVGDDNVFFLVIPLYICLKCRADCTQVDLFKSLSQVWLIHTPAYNVKRVMNVAGHGNDTRIRSLVIGESEFIICRCYICFLRAGDTCSSFV